MAKEFVKRIPESLQEKIGLKRFKISLIKCINVKQIKLAKMLLELKTKEIFENEDLQNKDRSVKFLKKTLEEFLINENIKNLDVISERVNKKINTITIQEIIKEEIEKSKIEFNKKNEVLKKNGVNVEVKENSKYNSYVSVLKHITKYFGDNYNVNNLNLENVQEYANQFKNDTYMQNLRTIFKNQSKKNPFLINWFEKVEQSTYVKFDKKIKKQKVKAIFYLNEIDKIREEFKSEKNIEKYYYFLNLIYSGMRNAELASIKKKDVRNNVFYLYDAKGYFEKVIPIHNTLIDFVNEKMNKLNDNDYLFFQENKREKSRVKSIRSKFNDNAFIKNEIKKTLHKTRSTFVTYHNYFKSSNNLNNNDITSITHKLLGTDQQEYNLTKNIKDLRKVIDSFELEKLLIVEEQIKNNNLQIIDDEDE